MPNMIADSIRKNPTSYGYETVPDWLLELTDSSPAEEDADMLRAARDRLLLAVEGDNESDYTARLGCRWQAAEIDVNLLPAGEAYQNMLNLITDYASEFTPEQLIRRGSYVTGMARYVGEQPLSTYCLLSPMRSERSAGNVTQSGLKCSCARILRICASLRATFVNTDCGTALSP